jgi:XTP/dITP diphosphohydrolase
MKTLVFATNNNHKIKEISSILGKRILLKSLNDTGCFEEIPETGVKLEDNALQKARFVYERYGTDCFADDTGLEVEALSGEPGVYSARYAGENVTYDDNTNKLLNKLEGLSNRKACFRTVIALIIEGREWLFEGRIDGEITHTKRGREGFGYDPVFIPAGYDKTFAEMDPDEKNRISHRALASRKLVEFLKKVKNEK